MMGVRILLFALLALPAMCQASEPLWDLLEQGGQVVLIRHAVTVPGSGDPPGMRLDDCRTQRNLSAEGRYENRDRQVKEMRMLLDGAPKGANLVLVSHGSTILALTGVSPAAGEMVIVTPQGEGRFALAGRLAP